MSTLQTDLQARWKPSDEQIALAHKALTETEAQRVYTVHVLIGKEYGWWTEEVAVHPIEGLIFAGANEWAARDAAMEAAAEHAKRINHLTAKKTVGGYTVHYLHEGEDHWAVFEDIVARFPKER